jgi:hypothetical protein
MSTTIQSGDQDLLRAIAAINDAAREGKITCPRALSLANALGLAPAVIGKAANKAGIKITGCQLGCFGSEREEG